MFALISSIGTFLVEQHQDVSVKKKGGFYMPKDLLGACHSEKSRLRGWLEGQVSVSDIGVPEITSSPEGEENVLW